MDPGRGGAHLRLGPGPLLAAGGLDGALEARHAQQPANVLHEGCVAPLQHGPERAAGHLGGGAVPYGPTSTTSPKEGGISPDFF